MIGGGPLELLFLSGVVAALGHQSRVQYVITINEVLAIALPANKTEEKTDSVGAVGKWESRISVLLRSFGVACSAI